MDRFLAVLNNYSPYDDINLDDDYYEDNFIQYYNDFKNKINDLKKNGDIDLKKIETFCIKKIIDTNNDAVDKIIENYLDSNENISVEDLKNKLRIIKNIILICEPGNITKKHINNIDQKMNKAIDKKYKLLKIAIVDEMNLKHIFEKYKPNKDGYLEDTLLLKEEINKIIQYYRTNYSLQMANRNIRSTNKKLDKIITINAKMLNLLMIDNDSLNKLINKYQNINISNYSNYDNWIKELRLEFEKLKEDIKIKYSDNQSKKIINNYDKEINKLIESKIKTVKYYDKDLETLREIFLIYENKILNIDSECQKDVFWFRLSEEERFCKKRAIYEEMFRQFKCNIREFNKKIRERYSYNYASKFVNKVNLQADSFNSKLAKKIGMPVASNPWFVRKYLWADIENFTSERGNKIRKIINRPLRFLVKLAVKNKIIIEEQQILDSSKPYIFVSTHYFTEDVIGLFVSIDRQVHMLMGTTDQIENNPLMIAAVLFGFFHVDRMDSTDRKLCFEKQNALINEGISFINYIGGSWENSENELQPLSFSGPYRTSKLKSAQIVPVSSCLVREDKKIYMRFGKPMDLSNYDEETANEIIRDTLASMHYKQIEKYTYPIKDVIIKDGENEFKTHDLPYDQHIYYMNQVGDEYWNQPWTKPFAKEEIGLRKRKIDTEDEVYSFIDNLSRDKLIKLSGMLSDIMIRMDESERYNIINYLDSHYEMFKERSKTRKLKK